MASGQVLILRVVFTQIGASHRLRHRKHFTRIVTTQNMLLVPTVLRSSNIHGIGVFAAAPIPKGTLVWQFEPMLDIRISERTLESLPQPARRQIESYLYHDAKTNEKILCGDDARFFNHSLDPNVIDDAQDPYRCLAARTILPGEELTQDYFTFDLLAEAKLRFA